MSQRQIARDLERKVIEAVQETIKREMAIVQPVLTHVEVALILMLLAKGTMATAAATICGMASPSERRKVFNEAVHQVVELVKSDEKEALERVAAAYAGQGR